MALTLRAVALVLLGLVPVAIWPTGDTVRLWVLAVVVLVGLDVLLAPSPKSLSYQRQGPDAVRLGEHGSSTVRDQHGSTEAARLVPGRVAAVGRCLPRTTPPRRARG